MSLHALEQVLAGAALDGLIDSLLAEDRAARLAELST
jgi:protein subunit release factor A